MVPLEKDITIRRGSTFTMELVSQIKVYNYDPATHNKPPDLIRTHAENLEHYGFKYQYIDFKTVYDNAELLIKKYWTGSGTSTDLLMKLTLEDENIEFTDKSVKINIPGEQTKDIDFSGGLFELLLTINEVLAPEDTAIGADSKDQIDCLVYGKVEITGEKIK